MKKSYYNLHTSRIDGNPRDNPHKSESTYEFVVRLLIQDQFAIIGLEPFEPNVTPYGYNPEGQKTFEGKFRCSAFGRVYYNRGWSVTGYDHNTGLLVRCEHREYGSPRLETILEGPFTEAQLDDIARGFCGD